jgi:DNA mismatch repair ATPase MutS
LLERKDWQRNQFLAPFAFALLWGVHFTYALERWRKENGHAILAWMNSVGELEALAALSGYAYERPEDPFPEIVENGAVFDGVDLGHPLIPREEVVLNSVSLGELPRALIVSGSNMSGKSTLLRTVGINAALAFAGAPVRAASLRLSPLSIGTTLRIQDSIHSGTSRFYAEIKKLRQLTEMSEGGAPLLFLLDELLSGTNSHDRDIGANALLAGLVEAGAIGLVTTHDLALTKAGGADGAPIQNVHFEDRLEGGHLVFDYRMRPGVVTKSNALALMRAVGLKV